MMAGMPSFPLPFPQIPADYFVIWFRMYTIPRSKETTSAICGSANNGKPEHATLFQFNSLILKPKMAVCATLIRPSHGDKDKLPDHTTPLIPSKSPLVANILPKIAPSPNDKS